MQRLTLFFACWALAFAASAAPVGSNELVQAARAQLIAMSGDLEGRLVFVAHEDQGRPLGVAAGTMRLQARKPKGDWPRRRVGVPVEITSGENVSTRIVWFTVEWWQQRLVYGHAYPKGTQVENLALVEHEVDVLTGGAAQEQAVTRAWLAGQQLARSVAKNQPAESRDFLAAPLVSRHQQVALHIRQGAVALNLPARTMSDGELGQHINVLPNGSTTPLRAKVTAANEVSIEH